MHKASAYELSAAPLPANAWMLGIASPFLIAFNLTPNATLFNQLAAFLSWGLVLVALPTRGERWFWKPSSPISWVGLLMLLGLGWSVGHEGLPQPLALGYAACLGAFVAVHAAARRLTGEHARALWWSGLCWALLLAGVGSVLISLVQVFWPQVADGNWIARSGLAGRAIGNVRQPNHLASLLMWSCIAGVYLSECGRMGQAALQRLLLPLLLAALVLADVLSASRTGMLGVLVLALWGGMDRSLSRHARLSLLLTPLMLVLAWQVIGAWAHSHDQVFGAESRLSDEGAGSPSRIAILSNAWTLLQRYPWTGVGAGEFNLAWTMTPFPDRPVAFFDHTHDLPMQLLVEFGVLVGGLLLVLLLWALVRLIKLALQANGDEARLRRSALMMVLMIGLHSLLEYPLWYVYFLLPTAFALGMGMPKSESSDTEEGSPLALRLSAALLIAGSLYAAWDYNKAVVIYAPPAGAASLEERIEVGQRSLFFSHLADYAAATSLPAGPQALAAAKRTAHNLIDARLMMAWARSLHASGDTERARYVVARLREFHNPAAQEWLDECVGLQLDQPAPFQCEPPRRDYDFREMR